MGRIADFLVGGEATLGGASAAGPVFVGLSFWRLIQIVPTRLLMRTDDCYILFRTLSGLVEAFEI